MPNIAAALLTAMNSRFVRIRTYVFKLNQLPDEPKAVEEACPGLTPSSTDNFTPAQHKIKDEEVTLEASKSFGGKQELSEQATRPKAHLIPESPCNPLFSKLLSVHFQFKMSAQELHCIFSV